MNIVLNEPALHALLNTREGPVGLEVLRKTAQTVENFQREANKILWRLPVGTVDRLIGSRPGEGNSMIVGVVPDAGSFRKKSLAQYLDEKATNEAFDPWPLRGLDAIFPGI